MIEIDADDEDPTEAVIVVDNAGTEQDNRLVDVTFVVDGDVLLVSFHVLAKPWEKAKVTNHGFMVAWGDLNEYLEYDKDASVFGREAPEKISGRVNLWPCGHLP